MRLRFEEHQELPRLAWLLELRDGDTTAVLHHGPWVETAERFFCDGAWDGEFARGEIAVSGLLMGTGGQIADGELVLATASHPFDALFAHRRADCLRVSPSLPFLLQRALTNRDHGPIVWQFVRDHWDGIEERFPRTLIARMIEGVTWLIDEESVRSVETFLAAHPIPEGARIIAQHLERQRTNRAVAVRDAADLAKHLART